MKPQQVQRYEATDYMGASLGRLIEISKALGVKASGSFEGPKQACGSVFAWGDADDIVWGQLPYKEMIKRKWFDLPRGAKPVERVREYFLQAAGPHLRQPFTARKYTVAMRATSTLCSLGRRAFWRGHAAKSNRKRSAPSTSMIGGYRMNCPPFRPDSWRKQEGSRISLRTGLCRMTISGSS